MIKSILIFFSIILLISCSVKEELIDKGTFRIKNDTINSFTSVTIDDSTFLETGYNKNGFVMTIYTVRLRGKDRNIGSLIGWSNDMYYEKNILKNVMLTENLRVNNKIIKNQLILLKKTPNSKKGTINNVFSFYYKPTKDSIIVNIPKDMLASFEKLETYVCILCSDELTNNFSNKETIKKYDTIFIDKRVNSSSTSKYLFFDSKNIKQNQNCYFQVIQKEKDNSITETNMYLKK